MESENLKIKKDLIKESQKADPSKNSVLSDPLDFYQDSDVSFGRDGAKYDRATKDEYISKAGGPMLGEHYPQMEHFVALLTKGNLRSSDVIKKNNSYYSRVMPIENMEPGKPQEVEAEIFLLRFLFADGDRYKLHSPKVVDEDQQIFEHQNYIMKDTGQFAHFDYGRVGYKAGHFAFREDDSSLVETTKRYFEYYEQQQEQWSPEQIQEFHNRLREKLPGLKDTLDDDVFFNAVVKKSELDLTDFERLDFLKGDTNEERISNFRKLLQNRIAILEEVLKEVV